MNMNMNTKQINQDLLNELYRKMYISKILFEHGIPQEKTNSVDLADDGVHLGLHQLFDLFKLLHSNRHSLTSEFSDSIDLSRFDIESPSPFNIYETLVSENGPFIPTLGNKLLHYTHRTSPGTENYSTVSYIFCSKELDLFIDNLKKDNLNYKDDLVLRYFEKFQTLFHPFEDPYLEQFLLCDESSSLHCKNSLMNLNASIFKYNIIINYTLETEGYYQSAEEYLLNFDFNEAVSFYNLL